MTGKARGGLGRGLAALIPTGPDTTTVADVLINGAGTRRDHGALSLVGGDDSSESRGGTPPRRTARTGLATPRPPRRRHRQSRSMEPTLTRPS